MPVSAGRAFRPRHRPGSAACLNLPQLEVLVWGQLGIASSREVDATR